MTITTRRITRYWTGTQKNTVLARGKATQVFVLPIPAARTGDLIEMKSRQEFTTNEDYPAGAPAFFWVDIFLSQDPNATSGISLCARGGTNITPGEHHHVVEACGDVPVPGVVGPWYVLYVANYDGDAVIKKDGRIEQGAGYGAMSVLVVPVTQWVAG